jgi:EAL domain-containing protein (putative c-di-GMP-specific phosphodiesterase class I)
VYQPLVDLGNGRCTGVEALVRWRHPVRGLVSPVEFIELAEETGLIHGLGAFVLDTSCRQFAAWQRALGPAAPRKLSVNLSRAQLADPDLTAMVQRKLTRHALDAGQLQLEITESLAAQGDQVQQRLHVLKGLGVALALDDFGTGFSSLSSLHLLPVDVVKIDRSFVSQAETSAHHRVLIQATINVAASLGMATVAEGVETEGQAAILAQLGCQTGQGYLYSRPLELEAATQWLDERARSLPPAP